LGTVSVLVLTAVLVSVHR